MSINEIISIFDKITTSKRAAQFAFSSLILLIPASIVFAIVFNFKKDSIQPIPDGKILSIILDDMPHGLSMAILALLIIFTTSTCFLVIDFIVALRSELKAINTKLLRFHRRKRMEETIFIKRAKSIRLLLDEEIDERVELVRMFYPYKNIVKISSDCYGNAIRSLVSDKILSVAFYSEKSGETYIRLDSRNEYLIRCFFEKYLDELIKQRYVRIECIELRIATHTVLSIFFDFFYYLIVGPFLLFIIASPLEALASFLYFFLR